MSRISIKKLEESTRNRVIKQLTKVALEGWSVEAHDEGNPLIVYNKSLWTDQRIPVAYTVTSPGKRKYHGDHVEFYHGPFRINTGGYRFFEDEPFVNKEALEEISEAFNILSWCNYLPDDKKGILKKIFKS